MAILIFPCNTYEAICLGKQLLAEGNIVIGVTSVVSEYSIDGAFTEVRHLPHISKDGFEEALVNVLQDCSVTHFWTSISAVYRVTKPILEAKNIKSLSCHPADQPLIPDLLLDEELSSREQFIKVLCKEFGGGVNSRLLHSMLKVTMSIGGQSHLDKLVTICMIYSQVPKHTDVVEIGSLWGRTAKLLNLLNKYYSVGNLLCIDPWPVGGVSQSAHKVLDSYSKVIDGNKYFSIFCSNLMAEGQGSINYIRDFSHTAIDTYLALDGDLASNEFGSTEYCKKVGLLHVDGNHSYENVAEDIKNYTPLVVSGGWIILDDYHWPYGDGVTRAADEYLMTNQGLIDKAFFVGGALFVKLC